MDKFANHYTFATLVKRFSDEFSLKNLGDHIKFQKFLSKDIIGKTKMTDESNNKLLTQAVDDHIRKTLTHSLQAHLEKLSKRVLKFINKEFMKV